MSNSMKFGKKDLVGKIYGCVTVIRRATKKEAVGVTNTTRACWVLKCQCGVEHVRTIDSEYKLVKRTRCGKQCMLLANKMVGKRFHKLVVVRKATKLEVPQTYGRSSGTTHWLVRCDCGQYRTLTTGTLVQGQRSCGCVMTNRDYLRMPLNGAGKRYAFRTVRRSAIDRDIPFKLTLAQFISIIEKPCTYCGVAWSKRMKSRASVYACNGVDRINSDHAYIIDNCTPCCVKCNMAKSDMSTNEFKQWLAQAYAHFITGDDYVEA